MSSSTPPNEFVTDTMGLVLRLEQRRFSPTARSIFEQAETGNAIIYVPAIVFAEILHLSEKQRISLTLEKVAEYLQRFPHYREYPMSLAVVQSTAQVTDIPELHDRLIAGTARLLGRALITNDPIIQASSFVKTVW